MLFIVFGGMGVGFDILLRSFGVGGLEEILRVEFFGLYKVGNVMKSNFFFFVFFNIW